MSTTCHVNAKNTVFVPLKWLAFRTPLFALTPGGTPYNGLYGERAPPERGTFFPLQVYKRVAISQGEIDKRVGKSIF